MVVWEEDGKGRDIGSRRRGDVHLHVKGNIRISQDRAKLGKEGSSGNRGVRRPAYESLLFGEADRRRDRLSGEDGG